DGYLDSGDALRHRALQETLERLERHSGGLPASLGDELRASLADLRRFADGELLAAGKLAADPQGLLLQAERELNAALRALARYAEQGDPQLAEAYPPRLLEAALHLQHLGLLRGQLASGRDSPPGELRQALAEL